MPNLKNILVKYFEEPFLKAELHRADAIRATNATKGYQEELSCLLVNNHRAFRTWVTK
jgi:hypothetical protein